MLLFTNQRPVYLFIHHYIEIFYIFFPLRSIMPYLHCICNLNSGLFEIRAPTMYVYEAGIIKITDFALKQISNRFSLFSLKKIVLTHRYN